MLRILLKALFAVLCVLLCPNANAQVHVTAPAGQIVGEWWSEPGNPGWGLVLTHNGEQTVVQHLDFDADGHDYWQVGVGPRASTTFFAPLIRTRWNTTTQSLADQTVTGDVSMTRVSDRLADVVLRIGTETRSVRLERIVVSADPVVRDATGLWLNPARPGIGLTLLSQGPVTAMLALAYDQNGAPRWWLAHGSNALTGFTDIEAKRFRRSCAPTCEVVAMSGGTVLVRWEDERHVVVQLALQGEVGSFTDNARYDLITAPASGRQYAAEARPFTNDSSFRAYLRLAVPPNPCNLGTVAMCRACNEETRVARDPNGMSQPWIFADAVADVGAFVASVQDPVWPDNPTAVAVALQRLDGVGGHVQTVSTFTPPAAHPFALLVLALPDREGAARYLVISDNGWSHCRPVLAPSSAVTTIRVSASGQQTIEREFVVDAKVDTVMRRDQQIVLLTDTPLLIRDAAGQVQFNEPSLRPSPEREQRLTETPIYLSPSGEYHQALMSVIEIDDIDREHLEARSLIMGPGIWVPGVDSVSIVSEYSPGLSFKQMVEIQQWSLTHSSAAPRGGSIWGSLDLSELNPARTHVGADGLIVVNAAVTGSAHAAEVWRIRSGDDRFGLETTRLAEIGQARVDGSGVGVGRVSHVGMQTMVALKRLDSTSEFALFALDRATSQTTQSSFGQFFGRSFDIDSSLQLGLQPGVSGYGYFDVRVREQIAPDTYRVGWTSVVAASSFPALTEPDAVRVLPRSGGYLVAAPMVTVYYAGFKSYLWRQLMFARVATGVGVPLLEFVTLPTLFNEAPPWEPGPGNDNSNQEWQDGRVKARTRVRLAGSFAFVFAGAHVDAVRLPL
ncbi:hypothetical protein C7S18_02120 [Ahniella affigens]|uniref:Uncharacterized protein n=1 Tax=Ahniella affigens TaxID=2021234 RepID=A0A2P1PMJ5_9GAMM|nr:hypothetical protein C7S18_02120 [Ahniella affigens]